MKFGVSLSGFAQQAVGTDPRQTLHDILVYVRTARDLGFDFIYQGQHYLTGPIQQLQTIPLLARAAAEAEGMGIVATLLVPLHSPVDLAERVTTMDVITGGRFTLSAALGYRGEEFDAFAVGRGDRLSRYTECIEVMKRLWAEDEVTFHGRHFNLESARLAPKPVQKPHPPIWVAANSDSAIKRAARMGYAWYINPHTTQGTIKRQIKLYRETADEWKSRTPAELPMAREVYVHQDKKEAFDQARPFLGGKYEAYTRWGQQTAMPREDSFQESFEDLAQDRFIIGTPEDCVSELGRYGALGIDRCALRMMWPGMALERGLHGLELFAREVMPAFVRS